jgi:hypothetical protein
MAMKLAKFSENSKWLVLAAAAQNWQVDLGSVGLCHSVFLADMAAVSSLAVTNGPTDRQTPLRELTAAEQRVLKMAGMIWLKAQAGGGVRSRHDAEVYISILQKQSRYAEIIDLLESPGSEEKKLSLHSFFDADVHGSRPLAIATCLEHLGKVTTKAVLRVSLFFLLLLLFFWGHSFVCLLTRLFSSSVRRGA